MLACSLSSSALLSSTHLELPSALFAVFFPNFLLLSWWPHRATEMELARWFHEGVERVWRVLRPVSYIFVQWQWTKFEGI